MKEIGCAAILYSVVLTVYLLWGFTLFIEYSATIAERQYVDLSIQVLRPEGVPARNAWVEVRILTENGSKRLVTGLTDFNGVFSARVHVPRKPAGRHVLENGSVVETFATVNLWVIASTSDSIESTIIHVDPTFMKRPVDRYETRIKLRKFEQLAQKIDGGTASFTTQQCQLPSPTTYTEARYYYSTFLEFATWDGISIGFRVPNGAKYLIESKQRYFIIPLCSYTGWESVNPAMITWDGEYSTTAPLTGRYVYSEQAQLKFIFERYWPPNQNTVIVEIVYATDTGTDGYVLRRVTTQWDGRLPGWRTYMTVPPMSMRIVEIYATSTYVFTVTVSFMPTPPFISLSLGIAKHTFPSVTLTIVTGQGPGSNYVAKVEASDPSFLRTRSNWTPT